MINWRGSLLAGGQESTSNNSHYQAHILFCLVPDIMGFTKDSGYPFKQMRKLPLAEEVAKNNFRQLVSSQE